MTRERTDGQRTGHCQPTGFYDFYRPETSSEKYWRTLGKRTNRIEIHCGPRRVTIGNSPDLSGPHINVPRAKYRNNIAAKSKNTIQNRSPT